MSRNAVSVSAVGFANIYGNFRFGAATHYKLAKYLYVYVYTHTHTAASAARTSTRTHTQRGTHALAHTRDYNSPLSLEYVAQFVV